MAIDAAHAAGIKSLFTQRRDCTGAGNPKLKLLPYADAKGRALIDSGLIALSRQRRIVAAQCPDNFRSVPT
jgi:hypothetical protein